MADHVIFHGCSEDTKRGIEDYWTQKGSRFERLLRNFPEDQRHMRLSIRRHSWRYEAQATLILPTGTLVAQENAKDCLEAVDIVADRLTAEIRKHRRVIRHDDAYHRRRPYLARAVEAAPVASSSASAAIG
jgi:ribosome-associated translation inhibitor RaiA